MITPLENWTTLRNWLPSVLGRTPAPKAIAVSLRLGSTEETVDKIDVAQSDETESVITRISDAVTSHTKHFETVRRALVRVRCIGEGGRTIYTSSSDVVAINDTPEDEYGGERPGSALPSATSSDELMRTFLAGGGVTTQLPVAAAYMPQFTLLAMLEQNRQMSGRFESQIASSDKTIDRLATALETMQEKYLEAQLGQRQAQLEADAEKKQGAIMLQDKQMKRDLVAMFSANLNKGLDLLFASATGLPPDDPQMQQAFLMGFVKKNPERAREMAKQLGLSGGALDLLADPGSLKPMLMAFAEKEPDKAAEMAAELFGELEALFQRKAAEADAAKAQK